MAYTTKVIDHFENPKNVGSLDKTQKNVGTGLVGAPECGDVMKLQDENKNLKEKVLIFFPNLFYFSNLDQ